MDQVLANCAQLTSSFPAQTNDKSKLNGTPLSFNNLFGHAWAHLKSHHQYVALVDMYLHAKKSTLCLQ